MHTKAAVTALALSVACGPLTLVNDSSALAADLMVYPGTLCAATSGSVFRTTDGAVSAVLTATVICPILRDAAKASGNALSFAHIVVKGQTVLCKLHRRDGSGGQGASLSKNLETSGGNGTRVLQFTTSLTTSPNGMYFFVCDLPPLAQVFSYRAEEAQ